MLKPSFLFRVRNPRRDQHTDSERFGRLAALVDQTAAEVAAEQRGLENRYKSSQSDAALLLVATENADIAERQAAQRLESLETTIIACERRLKDLAMQQDVLTRLREELTPLMTSTDAEPG